MLPQRIFLSGGGMCAMAHIGALIELSKYVHLKTIKEWMGVSAGALVALCLVIGFTLDELADFCIRFDFSNIKEYDSVPGWVLHYGIDTGERLHKFIEACLHVKKLSSDLTFAECYKITGLSLRVMATDLNEAKPITFSPKDTPHYKVADAVRASMSYPYYFQPHICPQTGHYLIDGGVISNYPLFVVPENEHNKTIGILIRTTIPKTGDIADEAIENIITRPLKIVLSEKQNVEARFYDAHCIEIQLGNLNILEFSFDEETKNFIIKQGKKAVSNFIKNAPKPKRRYSV